MITEMRDAHFASHIDAVANQISFAYAAPSLGKLEALTETVGSLSRVVLTTIAMRSLRGSVNHPTQTKES